MTAFKKQQAVTKFIEAVANCTDWKEPSLGKGGVDALFKLVEAAGFKVSSIDPGFWPVQERGGQNMDGTGRYSNFNQWCPYKVILEGTGDPNWNATGWLDTAVRYVRQALPRTTHEQIVRDLIIEVQRSIPLNPITLNEHGDALRENDPSYQSHNFFTSHTRDGDELRSPAGLHVHCGGVIEIKQSTETQCVLVCESCYLRIRIPAYIKTYGNLRKVIRAGLPENSAQRAHA